MDRQTGPDEGHTVLFPSIDDLRSFDANDLDRPASEWSIVKIGTLQAKIEAFKASKRNRGSTYSDGVPINKLISFANESFGHNGWSTEVLETEIVENHTTEEENGENHYSYTVQSKIRVTLKDGTQYEELGRGIAYRQPVRSMALSKAKKESVTEAVKNAIQSLNLILLRHESRLRTGYYVENFDDIFSY